MISNVATITIDSSTFEDRYSITQKDVLSNEYYIDFPEELIKANAKIIDPNSTSSIDEVDLNLSINITALSLTDVLGERFDVFESLFGYIDSIDNQSQSFAITVEDECGNTYEMYLSYLDVEKEDLQKIRVGARLVVVYGYEYKNGIAHKRTRIIFRTVGKWNKRKLEIYKNRLENRRQQ